jgi:anti-sigma factor RsiW
MNKEILGQQMQEASAQQRPSCARAEDLVTYLYGEAGEAEAQDFERHMQDCGSCRAELAAFGQARENIKEWRQHLLDFPAFEGSAVPALGDMTTTGERKFGLALAALRQFFTVSPVWMRAGTVAASVMICALAALAVARSEVRWDDSGLSFRTSLTSERVVERTKEIVVEKPVKVSVSEEELTARVEARVHEEMEALRRQQTGKQETIAVNAPATPSNIKESRVKLPTVVRRGNTSAGQTIASANSPDSAYSRRADAEEDLPRLYDLLGESY